MSDDIKFRKQAVSTLSNEIGVYVLADLDNVPIYVGQSTDGIKSRVARHLTSARSDIIANRQIDVWEVAFVWAYPLPDKEKIGALEATLFHHFDPQSQLINGAVPPATEIKFLTLEPAQVVQVMDDEELEDRKKPEQRLPRQAAHYAQIVGHFLNVKNSTQIARAMNAHFERLNRYHLLLLENSGPANKD